MVDKIPESIERVGGSTVEIINKLDSLQHILRFILLVFSLAFIGVGSWGAYKFIDWRFTHKVEAPAEILSKSSDGTCYYYREDAKSYNIEYVHGYDGELEGLVTTRIRFDDPRQNINALCNLIKEKVGVKSSQQK